MSVCTLFESHFLFVFSAWNAVWSLVKPHLLNDGHFKLLLNIPRTAPHSVTTATPNIS